MKKDVALNKLFLIITIISLLFTGCSIVSYTSGTHGTADITTNLSPVYAPLAEHVAERFDLADKEGIGIDIGGGSGNLVVELLQCTSKMHWINADIDPSRFPRAAELARAAGVGDRLSLQYANVLELPYHDNYADIFVSRGSFPFWGDLQQGLSEIYRVLKPGGIAFIGRGLSENLPIDIARAVRGSTGGGPKYDKHETARRFDTIMKALEIQDYTIELPAPEGSEGINYGIWLEFHKPAK